MDSNQIKCPTCGGGFSSQPELDEHAKEAHGNQASEGQEEHGQHEEHEHHEEVK